jgi:hypothetical protein
MKIFNIVLKVVLCLVLLSPVLGTLGVFPPPTPGMYTPQGYAFIKVLLDTGYLSQLVAAVFAIAFILILTGRMALAALLILPVLVNILFFHARLDGGLFTQGAMLADLLLALEAYFLWQNRARYKSLWHK